MVSKNSFFSKIKGGLVFLPKFDPHDFQIGFNASLEILICFLYTQEMTFPPIQIEGKR